ncbi:MAG: PBP1A family penicillin-binding protein [Candidatus Vogelbacteria bacterium]|nr:PBP1A family penicillin-binding protein [Candidatus Vogelbacteria bacterium]
MTSIKKYFSIKKILIKLGLVAVIFFFATSGSATLWAMTLQIPDFDSFFKERSLTQSTKIYDRTGKVLLYDVFGNARRTTVALTDISPYAQKATIAIEDADFYNHGAIKLSSIARAFLVNVSSGDIRQGGSTLTQQVIKNTLLTQDKKISRKIKEVILSVKLEQTMSKNDILALYLNESPYGGTIYGIEEAAQSFFGKKSKDLTLAEAAYLASLPQSPTYLSPYGKNKDRLDARKNLTLKKMSDFGWITKDEYNQALNEKVVFLPPEGNGIKAPHFVFYVIDQLEKEYSEETLKNNGFKVITTLDWELQKKAEELVDKYATKNEKDFGAKNVGIVVIDPKTGQILSMIGSRDYFDTTNDGNFNVTTAKRQPGSTFKPFVYATAFMKGYTPETVLFDVPTEFNTNCSADVNLNTNNTACYSPQNYDESYVGPITLRKALGNSRNVPAVKLLYLAGLSDSIKTAQNMGITTLTDPKRYGLSLVLGGGEVTLLEMTGAYSAFANDGVKNKTESITQIIDPQGTIIKEYKPNPKQVIPANVARLISNILKDNDARQPVFSANSALNVPNYDVAVKTGTTNNYRDAWIIGYTPSITIGAWAGNNDNTPMDKKVAGLIVAPLWNEFMRGYLSNKPNELFNSPDPIATNIKPTLRGIWQGGESYIIDSSTGKPATNSTPDNNRSERVIRSVHDILYWVDKNDPLGTRPTNPYNDPQFKLWEPPVRAWAAARGLVDELGVSIPNTPGIFTPGVGSGVKIINIKNEPYNLTDTVTVKLDTQSNISQADFFINNIYLASVTKNPFTYSFIPKDLEGVENSNEIKVVTYDINRNRSEAKAILLVNESSQ